MWFKLNHSDLNYMADKIQLNSFDALQRFEVPEPKDGELFHTTIITNSSSSKERFGNAEILGEKSLTLVEYPSGERGGAGIDVVGLLHEPFFWAFTLFQVVAGGVVGGFLQEAGSDLYRFFKGSVKKFIAQQSLPSQIYITYSESNSTLIVLVPAMITEEDVDILDGLIMEELKTMSQNSYSRVFFSPKNKALVPIYQRN